MSNSILAEFEGPDVAAMAAVASHRLERIGVNIFFVQDECSADMRESKNFDYIQKCPSRTLLCAHALTFLIF